MGRVMLVVYMSAILTLGGCASNRSEAAADAIPASLPATPRPKWAHYDWLDEHPVAKGTAAVAVVGGLIGCALLVGIGTAVLLTSVKHNSPAPPPNNGFRL